MNMDKRLICFYLRASAVILLFLVNGIIINNTQPSGEPQS